MDHRIWVETAVIEIADCFLMRRFSRLRPVGGCGRFVPSATEGKAWGDNRLSLADPTVGDSFCTPPQVALQPSLSEPFEEDDF
jgi:hypothetical protein